jgi:hypothetical protein
VVDDLDNDGDLSGGGSVVQKNEASDFDVPTTFRSSGFVSSRFGAEISTYRHGEALSSQDILLTR